eukprot:9479031-Pyramimonas_sp.AAC.1
MRRAPRSLVEPAGHGVGRGVQCAAGRSGRLDRVCHAVVRRAVVRGMPRACCKHNCSRASAT